MQVTRFQMHNVLECYSKKLSTAPGGERTAGGPSKKSADETALSPETSRMAAMDKISQQVLDKVMDAVALSGAPPVRWPVRPAGDEGAEFFRSRIADSIGDVEGGGPGLDGLIRGHDPALVISRHRSPGRPDGRTDHQEALSKFFLNRAGFRAGAGRSLVSCRAGQCHCPGS